MLYPRTLLLEKYKDNLLNTEGELRVYAITRERAYKKWGYVLRDEIWERADAEHGWSRNGVAYNLSGDYIGNSKWAYKLYHKYGISHTEKISPSSNICSIGFSPREQKWYGWSHRAIFGFAIGSKCQKGKCHYRPSNKEEFKESCLNFWVDEYSYACDDKRAEFGERDGIKGVFVRYTYDDKVPNEHLRGTQYENFSSFPNKYGKGEWVAKKLDDAKEMAIDFANSVS